MCNMFLFGCWLFFIGLILKREYVKGNCTPEEISSVWTPTPLVCLFGGSIVHSPWILKEKGPRLIRRLRVTQQAMDRAMLEVYLCDQIINEEIHRFIYVQSHQYSSRLRDAEVELDAEGEQ